MHDCAPPHISHQVRVYLDMTYPNRWIGRGGPTAWLTRPTPNRFLLLD